MEYCKHGLIPETCDDCINPVKFGRIIHWGGGVRKMKKRGVVHLSEKEAEDLGIIDKTVPICTTKGCEYPAMLRKSGAVVNGKCKFCHAKNMRNCRISKSQRLATHPPEIIIPLTDHPDIYECLKEAGKIHIRTPEHQALFFIVDGLKKEEIFKEDLVLK